MWWWPWGWVTRRQWRGWLWKWRRRPHSWQGITSSSQGRATWQGRTRFVCVFHLCFRLYIPNKHKKQKTISSIKQTMQIWRERTEEQNVQALIYTRPNALRFESGKRYVYKNSLPYFTLSFTDFNIPNVLLIIKSNPNYQNKPNNTTNTLTHKPNPHPPKTQINIIIITTNSMNHHTIKTSKQILMKRWKKKSKIWKQKPG